MKTTRIFSLAAAALCAALIAGCNTPESRIKDSPQEFARLNPDQQALVKAGQVAVGFDMDTVRLALGDPDRSYVVSDARGAHEVWHYITYEDNQGVIIFGGYYHRYRGWGGPRFGGGPGLVYYNGYPARVHDRILVIFDTAGRVAQVQQEKP
jgi:outer membrane protein assembly factor BamE (lipoprotein component of BamABCDE complex)